MKKIVYFLNTHPWTLVLLSNALYVGGAVLFLVLGIGIGISENYHPDGVSKTMMPMAYMLLGIAGVFALLSFVAWFWWRKLTGETLLKSLGVYVLLLSVGGFVAYTIEPSKPQFRTYKHGGYTYTIPREFSPSLHNDRLEIESCEQAPLIGQYAHPLFAEIRSQCKPLPHSIIATDNAFLLLLYLPTRAREISTGEKGFTIATSTDGLMLSPVFDEALLLANNIVLSQEGDRLILRSTVSKAHDVTLHIEARDGFVEWMSLCNISCYNYYPLPDNPKYMVSSWEQNDVYFDAGHIAREDIERYKVQMQEITNLFISFRE